MSEHHTGPVELGAEMNYAEHEKTYNGFLALTKYGTMMLCVLMLAMVAGFSHPRASLAVSLSFSFCRRPGSFCCADRTVCELLPLRVRALPDNRKGRA